MSRSRIYILIPVIFYLFLLCSNVVNAQVSIQGTGVSTHSFNYSTADTGIFNSPRQLLHYLAGAKSADPARMELRFQYDLTIGATQVSNQGVSIQFSINNGMMVGNSRFRNFDISTQLLPNFMNATLLVKNLTTGDTVITEPINSIKITNGSSQMHEVKVKLPSLSNPLQISLSEIRFYHLPDFSNKILSQIVLINEHEAALFLLKHCSNLLEGINCRHPDHIPECFLNLLAIERILVKVEQSRFDERLMLPPHDPAGFLRRFELIKNKHSLMSRDFLSTLRQTRTIYPTKLDEELVMQYVDEISRINMLASEAGFAYAPYISDLARLQIVSERADSLSQLTREIAVKLAGSGSGHNNYTRLMNMAYNAMLSEARNRLQANDYHNALVMFNNSMKFCEAFPEVECKPAVFHEISKAHHGLYDSYLSVARRAMEIGRPELAERYIRLAAEYQQNNSSSIITNIRVTEMNVRLFDAFVEKARQFNNLAAFDTAAAMLKRAANPEIGITPTQGWRNQMAIARNGQLRNLIAALQSETKLNRTTQAIDAWQKADSFIEQEIKTPALLPQTVQFMQEATNDFSRLLIAEASDDFRNRRFGEVLNKFLIIEDLESYGVIIPASALLIKKQTGRLIVDSLMMSVALAIHQGNTSKALSIFSRAEEIIARHALKNDPEIIDATDKVYNAFLSVECMKIQLQIDDFARKALIAFAEKNFLEGMQLIEEGRRVSVQEKSCRLNDRQLNELTNNYMYVADYQELLLQANEAWKRNDYSTSIVKIENAALLFRNHNLHRFDINGVTLLSFAQQNDDIGLRKNISRRFIQLNRYEDAIKALDLMRRAGAAAEPVQEIQQNLGRLMGVRDSNSTNRLIAFLNAGKYGTRGAWYQEFRKSYRSALFR